MTASDCIFCKIIKGDIPCARIYEDDAVLAFLDINPWSEGHTLIIPKAHYALLHECPADVIAGVAGKFGRIAEAVVSAMGAVGYNILNNNGSAAGQEIEHVHFHIIPRKPGDQIIRHAPQLQYPEGRIEELAAEILNHLT